MKQSRIVFQVLGVSFIHPLQGEGDTVTSILGQ